MKRVFVTEPYLLTLDPAHEMQVVWIQRSPQPGEVEYGSSHVLGRCVQAQCYPLTGLRLPASEQGYAPDPEDNPLMELWQCVATIRGLQPGTRVFYRCTCDNYTTRVYDFHTAPLSGEPFRFAQMSDLQGFLPCDESAYQIGRMHPDFILFSGDMAYYSWRADQWFDLEEPWQGEESRRRAFFPCMQQQGGARLMQYCPVFVCPGNHEVDDFRVGTDPEFAVQDDKWTYSIFMQLFRPLYPEMDASIRGKRWYSVDYSDLHLVSLNIWRWSAWGAETAPGWRLMDEIAPDSPQIRWLTEDLSQSKAKFKWVIEHWHLLNKGDDVQYNLCQPHVDEAGVVTYPHDYGQNLMAIFEKHGVNAVSYGHSHVYERYFCRGVHYIEAAFLGICYRGEDHRLHPSGLEPLVEDNSRCSFLMVHRNGEGLVGVGMYLDDPPVEFDRYTIAPEPTGKH